MPPSLAARFTVISKWPWNLWGDSTSGSSNEGEGCRVGKLRGVAFGIGRGARDVGSVKQRGWSCEVVIPGTIQEWWATLLKIHPWLDPLRDDPRFEDMVRRMNFPDR